MMHSVTSGPLTKNAAKLLNAIEQHADEGGVVLLDLHEFQRWLQDDGTNEQKLHEHQRVDVVLEPLMDELLPNDRVRMFYFSPDNEGHNFQQFLLLTCFDPGVAMAERRGVLIPGWQPGDTPESFAARTSADYRSVGA